MARRKRSLTVLIVSIEAWLAVLAWRDLARRPDDEVRGKKHLWRIFVSINPGNSLIYWLVGRR